HRGRSRVHLPYYTQSPDFVNDQNEAFRNLVFCGHPEELTFVFNRERIFGTTKQDPEPIGQMEEW
ncbi:MAG: hypothetical protein IJU49_01295, partial [Lachnospiraceae bacterium]|nr:hypothetical protein [Lachnospiraceae bacterium]